ncbi:unnamed protein product, partial [Acidocella sp. C78]
VYFAPGASVDVGGLVASTRAITDQDFMAGSIISPARARRRWSIAARSRRRGGYVAFIGGQVDNAGRIVAAGRDGGAGGGGCDRPDAGGRSLVHFEVSRAALAPR